MTAFYKVLREVREGTGLSRSDAAGALEDNAGTPVSMAALTSYEKGEVLMPAGVLYRLSDAWGISLNERATLLKTWSDAWASREGIPVVLAEELLSPIYAETTEQRVGRVTKHLLAAVYEVYRRVLPENEFPLHTPPLRTALKRILRVEFLA